MLKNVSLIAGRDLRSYFYSPVAYIVIAMFLFLIGWMFSQLLSFYAQQVSQYAQLSFGEKPKLVDSVIRPLFGNINVILLFVAPFITMRLIAEEKKDHTIELLKTAPIGFFEIVLGKFFAGFFLILIMMAVTFVYPAILFFITKPDWGVILSCYVGIFCVSAVYVSVGLFWSSRTENQIVAAVLTFGTLLFFWLIGWASHRAGPVWSDILNHLSIIGHYTNFAQGIIDTTDIVFYFSFVGFALFLTNLSVKGE